MTNPNEDSEEFKGFVEGSRHIINLATELASRLDVTLDQALSAMNITEVALLRQDHHQANSLQPHNDLLDRMSGLIDDVRNLNKGDDDPWKD